jgi:hypothetical protein
METRRSRIKLLVAALLSILVGFYSSEAFPWGFATHAYIGDHLGKTSRFQNMQEIYGGVAPDTFNYLFDSIIPYGTMSMLTHQFFVELWDLSRRGLEKSLAYGFVSHNDVWGADSTAHHSGLTFGQNEGYVIAKARILGEILKQVPEYAALGLPDDVTLEISHELVEDGVDLLVKGIDPLVGQKLSSSALSRSPGLSGLLIKAYVGFMVQFGINRQSLTRLIIPAEREFRRKLIVYGHALMQDEATTVQLISEETAEIAAGFLKVYGITLPPDSDIVPLIEFGIEQSIELCADDFAGEISATIDFVDQNLEAHGISY